MALILKGGQLQTLGGALLPSVNVSPNNPATFRSDDARWLPISGPAVGGANQRVQGWGECTSWTIWELICRHSVVQEVLTLLSEAVGMLDSSMQRTGANGVAEVLPDDDEAQLINDQPAPNMTKQEWVEAILWDLLGFGNAFALKIRFHEGDRLWLLPLPAELMAPAKSERTAALAAGDYLFGGRIHLPAAEVMHLPLAPVRSGWGMSPLVALSDALAEQAASAEYRKAIYEKGVSVAGFAEVPSGVEMTEERIERLRLQLQNRHGGPKGAGSVAMLEDGIKFVPAQVDPRSLEHLEVRRLTSAEVRGRYGISDSSSAGSGDGAAYASKKADAQHLYGTVLAPKVRRLDQRITLELRQELGRSDFRRVTSWAEKLRPDPEAEARQWTTLAGGPIVELNEARAAIGYGPVAGGDRILRPLNHDAWGDVRPAKLGEKDGPPTPATKADPDMFEVKAIERADQQRKHAEVLERTFGRQAAAVLKTWGKGDGVAFDRARWDRELADDLAPVVKATAGLFWTRWALELDINDPGTPNWDDYARIEAESAAKSVNDTTAVRLAVAAEADDPADAADAIAKVFSDDRRISASATRSVSTISGFVGVAAGTKAGFTHKRWVDGSGDSDRHPPQPDTVPIGETFSNGGRWPGEGDDTYGCDCYMVLTRG